MGDDGRRVATAGGDGFMKKWVLESGELKYSRATLGECSSVCYCAGGNVLAMGYGNGAIQVYDNWGTCHAVFHCDEAARVEGLALRGGDEWLASCSGHGRVRLWDLHTRTLVHHLNVGSCRPWCVAFCDEKSLVCGTEDGAIRTWDFGAITVPRYIGGKGVPATIAFSPWAGPW